jgi:hypothetical protein
MKQLPSGSTPGSSKLDDLILGAATLPYNVPKLDCCRLCDFFAVHAIDAQVAFCAHKPLCFRRYLQHWTQELTGAGAFA